MNARILHTAAASLALIVVLAGCGGGGDDDSTETTAVATTPTTTTLGKEEFISQGDAICAEVNAAIGTVGTAEGTEAAALVEQEADLYSGMVDRLRSLGTPDDSSGYPEFIAAADDLAEAEGSAALAAAREDSVALQNAEADVSSAFSTFQAAAEEYGFEDCGNPPSAPAASGGAGGTVEEEGAEAIEEEAEVEAEPEVEEEAAPEETGGAGTEAGGGAEAGGGTETGGGSGGGGESGGIGPG